MKTLTSFTKLVCIFLYQLIHFSFPPKFVQQLGVILIILTSLSSLFSCSPNEAAGPGTTSPSSLSVNTVRATINSVTRTFKSPIGASYMGTVMIDQYSQQSKLVMDGSERLIDGTSPVHYIRLQLMPFTGAVGVFPVSFTQTMGSPPNFILYSEGNYGALTDWRATTGTVEITKSDKNVVEGTFTGTFAALKKGTNSIDPDKKTFEIKDGVFKIIIK